MNNEKNPAPTYGETPAQNSKDNSAVDSGRSRTRRDISAEAAHVLKFLNSCTPYQADAVRVIAGHATGKQTTIEAADMLAVNRFLNHGMNRSNTASTDAAIRFRVERSDILLKAVRPFCQQDGIIKAASALMRIATDAESVKKAFGNLPDGK